MKMKEIADVLYKEFENTPTIVEIDEVSPIEDEEIINVSFYDTMDMHTNINMVGMDADTAAEIALQEDYEYIDAVLKRINVDAEIDLDYELSSGEVVRIYGTIMPF
jgi:carbamoylphosphate synthase large subunit